MEEKNEMPNAECQMPNEIGMELDSRRPPLVPARLRLHSLVVSLERPTICKLIPSESMVFCSRFTDEQMVSNGHGGPGYAILIV
jgi:hypothetical protein